MGTTCSARTLTEFDKKVIDLCKEISTKVESFVPDKYKDDYNNNYGKIAYSRDCGSGRGGGKLERDAVTTRGRTAKAPFSNRNLRWHPLVVSSGPIPFAKVVERVYINENEKLVFVIKLEDGREQEYDSDHVHELPERYTVTKEKWEPIKDVLKTWDQDKWNKNLCVIPSLEACEWYDSVETYAVLAITVSCGLFGADFNKVYEEVTKILREQTVSNLVNLPTNSFPTDESEFLYDPITRIKIDENLNKFRTHRRTSIWNPNWLPAKRDEGDDSSIQLMHLNPLVENEIRHKADNVRYGFRWSNVSMTDHSVIETLHFFKYSIDANNIAEKLDEYIAKLEKDKGEKK